MHRSLLLAPILGLFAINALADSTKSLGTGFPPPSGAFQSTISPDEELSKIPMPSPSVYSPIPEIDPAFSSKRPTSPSNMANSQYPLPSSSTNQLMPGHPEGTTPYIEAGPAMYGQSMPQPWSQIAEPSNMMPYGDPSQYGWNDDIPSYVNPNNFPVPAYPTQWNAQPNITYIPATNGMYQPMMQNVYPVMPQVIYEWVPIGPAYDTQQQPAWQGQHQMAPNYQSDATFRPPYMQGTN